MTPSFQILFSNGYEICQNYSNYLYAALKPGGRLVIASVYADANMEDPATEKVTVNQIEGPIIGNFISGGYSADIIPAAELQAHIAKASQEFYYKFPRLKDLHRMLEKAGFQDIQSDAHLFWNEFKTLDACLDAREASSWLYIFPLIPQIYRDAVRLRLRELLRAAWEKVPVGQRENPIRDSWPVVFIQAKKANMLGCPMGSFLTHSPNLC